MTLRDTLTWYSSDQATRRAAHGLTLPLLAVVASLLLSTRPAASQVQDTSLWVANGSVATIAHAGGQAGRSIAAVDAMSGSVIAWNPDGDGSVLCLALSGGTLYAGGNFRHIGGSMRNRIAAVDPASGVAGAWNPNANNSVSGL